MGGGGEDVDGFHDGDIEEVGAFQAGDREDDGVVLAFAEFAKAGVDVAPSLGRWKDVMRAGLVCGHAHRSAERRDRDVDVVPELG